MGIRVSKSAVAIALMILAACGGDDAVVPPGPPTAVAELSSTTLSGTVGTTLDSLRVRVTDADGRGVPGISVDFQITEGNGTVAVPPPPTDTTAALRSGVQLVSITDANGNAAASWTLGTQAGPQAVSASVAGLTSVVEFAASADPDVPAGWGFTTRTAFAGTAGQSADGPLAVRVTDQFSNAVPGVSVGWAALDAGASVSAATTTTDSLGKASVSVTLGPSHGLYLYTAMPSGLPLDTISLLAVVGFADSPSDAGDPGGTGLVAHDITFVGGTVVDSLLFIYVRFGDNVVGLPSGGGNVPSNTVVGVVELDVDQDSTTGFQTTRECIGGDPLGFGVDGIFDLNPTSALIGVLPNPAPGTIAVLQADSVDQIDTCVGSVFLIGIVPLYFENTLLLFGPIGFIEDDGVFDLTSFMANGATFGITDFAPDSLGATFNLGPVATTGASLRTGRGRAEFLRHFPRPLTRTAAVRVRLEAFREMRLRDR